MKPKLKKIIIFCLGVLLILGLAYWRYVEYWKEHAYEKLFNMEEILGKTDNNSYGIRNDVYDFLVKEEFVKWNMDEKQKNLVLNIAHYDQLMIKNFSNKEKVLKIFPYVLLLIHCDKIEKWPHNGNSKYREILEKHPDSKIIKDFYNTIGIQNQSEIVSLHWGKTNEEVQKLCEKFENEVSKDE